VPRTYLAAAAAEPGLIDRFGAAFRRRARDARLAVELPLSPFASVIAPHLRGMCVLQHRHRGGSCE